MDRRKHHGTRWSTWSPAEEAILEQRIGEKVLVKVIAEELGRTEQSVRSKLVNSRAKLALATDLDYRDDADPFIVWVCDELSERKIPLNEFLTASKVSARRFWDFRHRPWNKPPVEAIVSMLAYLGYKLEIVPTQGNHNGTDNKNPGIRPVKRSPTGRRRS